MKLEEIESLWEQDSKIDRTDLDNESLKIPMLHSKYYKIYLREKIQNPILCDEQPLGFQVIN
jgi:hypothetical protein